MCWARWFDRDIYTVVIDINSFHDANELGNFKFVLVVLYISCATLLAWGEKKIYDA